MPKTKKKQESPRSEAIRRLRAEVVRLTETVDHYKRELKNERVEKGRIRAALKLLIFFGQEVGQDDEDD